MKFLTCLISMFLLIHSCCLSSISYDNAYNDLHSHDNFFRALGFKKIEKVCFQLSDDLDIFTHGFLSDELEQSGYLLKQFCCLFTSIQELISNQEESRMFLPDDITYLLGLLDNLERKLKSMEFDCQKENPLIICINVLLEQGKQKLEMLVENNIEVLFDITMLELHPAQC